MECYSIIRGLAAVRNGTVLLCADKRRTTGDKVAIKRIRVTGVAPSVEQTVHRRLSAHGGHRHVLQLLDDFTENGFNHYVLEYCPHGDLFGAVDRAPHRRLDPAQACEYFGQICDGLVFIHGRGIAHCDLSLENVLLDACGDVKVSDFGLAVDAATPQHHPMGKHFYMAPEMLVAHPSYDATKADVWALGIMLFIMLTGNPLFERAAPGCAVLEFMAKHGLEAIVVQWQLDHLIPSPAMDLLEKMLCLDPVARPTMAEVMTHEYVQGLVPPPVKTTHKRKHMASFLMQHVFGTKKNIALFQ
ncbi:Aste57867_20813 [Aphanomyces stellatus]|uniref:Aste57867_20813 protein n=1 Tax=Aphanomyces stellatus TaxID=120398 RepID=A0A485LG09_9STRA|nr:hypothetical protein As57867_020745 [Aphanomyces stellatus]VFT97492.1 Aste57867_20813 [Aphanomyces stellatus]